MLEDVQQAKRPVSIDCAVETQDQEFDHTRLLHLEDGVVITEMHLDEDEYLPSQVLVLEHHGLDQGESSVLMQDVLSDLVAWMLVLELHLLEEQVEYLQGEDSLLDVHGVPLEVQGVGLG